MIIGEIPNVFSPNGDLANDFFTFEVINPKEFEVSIFNRWGNIVYETTDASAFFWNGKAQEGNFVEDGVYFYKYRAVGYQDEIVSGQGFLHLVR